MVGGGERMRMGEGAQQSEPEHTPRSEGGSSLLCPSGSISCGRLVPYPTPQGEEEDNRLDGIEQSTHVSFYWEGLYENSETRWK